MGLWGAVCPFSISVHSKGLLSPVQYFAIFFQLISIAILPLKISKVMTIIIIFILTPIARPTATFLEEPIIVMQNN